MRALVFGVEPESGNEQESGAGRLTRNLAATPMGLREIDGPSLPGGGRVDLRAILMYTFPLDEWRSAFGALADQGSSGAVKVAFDLR